MQYLMLLIVIIMVTAQNVVTKQYDIMTKEKNIFLFSAITAFMAMIFFIFISGFKLVFCADYMIYSVGFGVSYAVSTVAMVLAIMWGSMSITGLVTSYSLIIPTFFGLFALNEKIGIVGIVGIGCLLLSLFLINDVKEEIQFSFKWIVAVLFAFVGNGMCSTIQKMQQIASAGKYKNEFMIVALLIVSCAFVILSLIRKEKIRDGTVLCVSFGALRGGANGIANLLVMVLAGTIPNVLLFPSVTAGGIVLSFIIAICIYKEKLTRQQLVGYVIGTISVVLLNL